MIIEQPSVWLRWLYPKALWRMDRHEKAVYLTFDDGPTPEATPYVLVILARYHIKATFFMVGDNVRKYPELYERVVSEGHRIGNHTHNHISGIKHSVHDYSYNVEKANAYLHTNLVRPPHGWMRGSIITFHDSLKSIDKLKTALPQAIEWLQQQGYQFKTFE